MKGEISNLRRGGHLGKALAVVPPLLLGALLAGVPINPGLDVGAARARVASAESRLAELGQLKLDAEAFQQAHGFERVRQAALQLNQLLPPPLELIEIHGAMRFLTGAHQFELQSIDVSDARPIELPGTGPPVAIREVTLTGKSRLDNLVLMIDRMRAIGYPAAVLDFSLGRQEPEELEFEVLITVGLFHRLPPHFNLSSSSPELDSGGEFQEESP